MHVIKWKTTYYRIEISVLITLNNITENMDTENYYDK